MQHAGCLCLPGPSHLHTRSTLGALCATWLERAGGGVECAHYSLPAVAMGKDEDVERPQRSRMLRSSYIEAPDHFHVRRRPWPRFIYLPPTTLLLLLPLFDLPRSTKATFTAKVHLNHSHSHHTSASVDMRFAYLAAPVLVASAALGQIPPVPRVSSSVRIFPLLSHENMSDGFMNLIGRNFRPL